MYVCLQCLFVYNVCFFIMYACLQSIIVYKICFLWFPWRNQLRRSPCDQKIMGSNPGIVLYSKISSGFGNPLEKQTFTNAAVHPAVMGSWEENMPLQCPCRQYRKLNYVRVEPFPMISGVIVKSWEKLQHELRLKNQHRYLFFILALCLALNMIMTCFDLNSPHGSYIFLPNVFYSNMSKMINY